MKDEVNIKNPTKAEKKIIKRLHQKYNAKKVKEEKNVIQIFVIIDL